MDGDKYINVSSSDCSEIEILSISSDEEETSKPGAGADTVSDRVRGDSRGECEGTRNDVTPGASTSNPSSMTCMREQPGLASERHRHSSYKNKTWSQVRKEKEERKYLPPASKKARLSVPLVPVQHYNKLSRCNQISDDDGEFSDELPDLDHRQKTPEHQPVDQRSPIILSSDEDGASNRRGLFASLSIPDSKTETKVQPSPSPRNVSSKQKSDSFVKNLLLTKTTKDKMAKVIGKFLKTKNPNEGEARPYSPSAFSDVSSGSSKRSSGSRHFMDVISESIECPQSPVLSLSDVSESTQIEVVESGCEEDRSDSEEDGDGGEDNTDSSQGDDDYEPPDSESLAEDISDETENSSPKKLRLVNLKKDKSKQITQTGIRKYFQASSVQSDVRTKTDRLASSLVSYNSQLAGEADDLATALTHLHVNTIEAALEEGEKFLDYGLSLISDFSSRLKPTETIVKEILDKCLVKGGSLSLSYKAYRLLSEMWQRYPSCIYIDWEQVSQVLGNLSLEKGCNSQPTETIVRGGLFLQLLVQAIETDLYRRNLHHLAQIRMTQAYKHLSVDKSYYNMKQIVYWVGSIITSEYKTLACVRRDSDISNIKPHVSAGYVPKILPNFQRLLHLGIEVSRNCVDAAKRIARELVPTYMLLSEIRQKKLLLQTISSDLLRFKVTQKILEEYCDGTRPCCEDFPVSLRQVVQAYYLASPPRSLVTPPQSPSDDESLADPAAPEHQYSASSCEELSMLIYNNTQSYLYCAHSFEYEPLVQRPLGCNKNNYSFVSKCDLQMLRGAVDELHGHLLQLTPEVNTSTHTYLFMMQCLATLNTNNSGNPGTHS